MHQIRLSRKIKFGYKLILIKLQNIIGGQSQYSSFIQIEETEVSQSNSFSNF